MKTLEVTDEQYAFIQHLREEISESVVGKYGFVRERDAVQYLIDNLDDEIELDAAEFDSSATDDVAASVGAAIDGDDDPHGLAAVSYVEGETAATAVDEHPDDAPDDLEAEEIEPETDDEDGESTADKPTADDGDDESAASSPSDDTESDADSDEDAGSDSDSDGSSEDGSADDDDMLDEMMSLLETHDDKWEESGSADYRYAVDLPDGSTEQVQTKDDVRALLFKNYR